MQVGIVQTVAAIVLVGELAERPRPAVLRVQGVVADPRGGHHEVGRVVPGDAALELDPEHKRGVVPARFEVGHGRQDRDAP